MFPVKERMNTRLQNCVLGAFELVGDPSGCWRVGERFREQGWLAARDSQASGRRLRNYIFHEALSAEGPQGLPGRKYVRGRLNPCREDGFSARLAVRRETGERGDGSRPGNPSQPDMPGRNHPWASAERWAGASQRRGTCYGN